MAACLESRHLQCGHGENSTMPIKSLWEADEWQHGSEATADGYDPLGIDISLETR